MATSGPDFTSRYTIAVGHDDRQKVENIVNVLGCKIVDFTLTIEAPPIYQEAVGRQEDDFMRTLEAISGVEAVSNDSHQGDGTNVYDYAYGQFEYISDHFHKVNLAILDRCALDLDYPFGPAILYSTSIIFAALRMQDEGEDEAEIVISILDSVAWLLGYLLCVTSDLDDMTTSRARAALNALEANRPQKPQAASDLGIQPASQE